MRQDIVNIVNELAKKGSLDFELKTTYDLILNYCKANKTSPSSNTYDLNNGVLVINGVNIERVQPLKKVKFDEQAYYWEGRILARQESEV